MNLCVEKRGENISLQEEIPRQMFKIAIQASIGGNVVAQTNISALRKDVTG